VARGLPPRGAVLLLWAAGFVAGWPALIVSQVDPWAVVGIWSPGAVMLVSLALQKPRRIS